MARLKETYDARLLERQEDRVRQDVAPEAARRLFKRLRHTSILMRVDVPLVTERAEDGTTRAYNLGDTVKVTVNQAVKLMIEYERFNRVKEQQGQRTGRVQLTRYGRCLFIG